MDSMIEQVDQQLPMSYEFSGSCFYIRTCYPEYYVYITTLLNDLKYISLTGTPGIGKSVLYIYFFQRFRKENPNTTIVTASFGKDRKLEKCLVFETGKEAAEFTQIPKIPGSLHLYDGPPTVKPSDNKMVCFTSPNFSWLDGMRKAENHAPLYLPAWSESELEEANLLLGIGLSEATLKQRFLLFGGCARYCLTKNDMFYDFGLEGLKKKANSIRSFEAILDCLNNKADKESISHSIFYYDPVLFQGKPVKYHFKFCSAEIAKVVNESITEKSNIKRKELVHWLRGTSKSSALLGWLLEGEATEIFTVGGTFPIRSLSPPGQKTDLVLGPGKYEPAKTDTCESYDGTYFADETKTLYFFQITRNYDHPLNAHGLVEYVERMKFSPDLQMRSIFVVPKGMSDYKKQKILFEGSEGMSSHVSCIRGVGPKAVAALKEKHILTVQHLADAIQEQKVPEFEGRFKRFQSELDQAAKWACVNEMPQYVLELEVDYK
eukprot:Lithocolla_globosa_v1_NODE_384_length_4219_cov_29.823487.p1 type:complete len:491 gc:universal NODE_384_length_4219_cov_29.823487:1886-3358(+)